MAQLRHLCHCGQIRTRPCPERGYLDHQGAQKGYCAGELRALISACGRDAAPSENGQVGESVAVGDEAFPWYEELVADEPEGFEVCN